MKTKIEMTDLLRLEDALRLSAAENRDNHRQFINPELTTLMRVLHFDRCFVKAEGCSVWDDEGNEYLDFLGGYGALNLGHNPPEIMEALGRLNTPNLLQVAPNRLAGALAKNLARITPGALQYSFFCNSGAEAIEGALKIARAASKRCKIISCEGAFHGKSFGALSVTGRGKYREPFGPLVPDVAFVRFGDEAELEDALKERDVAAFIVEPIQGEGGILVPPPGYFKKVREICTKYETVLIVDEIQTGFGRTGDMFACEYEEIVPDVLCLSKSFGGGVMPLAAYSTTAKIWRQAYGSLEKATLHTSTFGGNSLAAAAGLVTLEMLYRDKLSEQAQQKGEYLLGRLNELRKDFPLLKEVRGRGLLIGLEFAQEKRSGIVGTVIGAALGKITDAYLGAMVAGSLLNQHRMITAYTLNNPNVIRLEPPLIISYAQIDRLVDALREIFENQRGVGRMVLASGKTLLSAFAPKRRG